MMHNEKQALIIIQPNTSSIHNADSPKPFVHRGGTEIVRKFIFKSGPDRHTGSRIHLTERGLRL